MGTTYSSMDCCRPLRGFLHPYVDDPGVPLRSTPGFMLTPRFAGSMQIFEALIEAYQGLSLR